MNRLRPSSDNPLPVQLSDICAAAARLSGEILRTPLLRDPVLEDRLGHPVWHKAETRQPVGAFKLRGAMNAVLQLSPAALSRGVVTASTGNHGRALGFAARRRGARAVVCLSHLVPANKVAAIEALGADVRRIGQSQDDAQAEVARLVAAEGLTEVPPFDDPCVVAGQGTIGLEIVDDLPTVDTLLVPLSGGGLAAGVAMAVKALAPGVRVVGVSMARGAAMAASLAAGHPVTVTEQPTLADSLGGGIGCDNRITFAMCRALLDDVILLTEPEIAAGMRHARSVLGETVEGAGAVGIAALLTGRLAAAGTVVTLLSGGNVDPALHRAIMAGANALEPA